MGIGVPSNDSTKNWITLTRTSTNNGGSTITMNEIGLYVKALHSTNAAGMFCMIRDVIAGGQAITNGQMLTATYTLAAAA